MCPLGGGHQILRGLLHQTDRPLHRVGGLLALLRVPPRRALRRPSFRVLDRRVERTTASFSSSCGMEETLSAGAPVAGVRGRTARDRPEGDHGRSRSIRTHWPATSASEARLARGSVAPAPTLAARRARQRADRGQLAAVARPFLPRRPLRAWIAHSSPSPHGGPLGRASRSRRCSRRSTLTALSLRRSAQALTGSAPRTGCSGSGNCATSVVPLPDGLSSVIVPPNASILSFSPTRPEPQAGSAPPTPSSRTQTQRRPWRSSTVTSMRDASACFVVFVSVSATSNRRQLRRIQRPVRGAAHRAPLGQANVVRVSSARERGRRLDRAAGCNPEASVRSSSSTAFRSAARRSNSVSSPAACAASDPASVCALIASTTIRCCAPSWRSRSTRRRASSAALMIRTREASSSDHVLHVRKRACDQRGEVRETPLRIRG